MKPEFKTMESKVSANAALHCLGMALGRLDEPVCDSEMCDNDRSSPSSSVNLKQTSFE